MVDWSGEFGDAYTERNADIPSRRKFWSDVIPDDAMSAYEIGCNIGANLEAIDGIPVSGCDLNRKAVEIAREKGLDVELKDGLLVDTRADFVFTSGVLIHLQTPGLIRMMRHMRSLSFKYVFFNEYGGDFDEEIPYRGLRFSLYKRAFGDIYQTLFPYDQLLRQGAGDESFDRTTWWLFQK